MLAGALHAQPPTPLAAEPPRAPAPPATAALRGSVQALSALGSFAVCSPNGTATHSRNGTAWAAVPDAARDAAAAAQSASREQRRPTPTTPSGCLSPAPAAAPGAAPAAAPGGRPAAAAPAPEAYGAVPSNSLWFLQASATPAPTPDPRSAEDAGAACFAAGEHSGGVFLPPPGAPETRPLHIGARAAWGGGAAPAAPALVAAATGARQPSPRRAAPRRLAASPLRRPGG